MNGAYVHPAALRPPTAWLVPRVSSRTTPQGFTETTTSYFEADLGAVYLAAERVISDLRKRPRAEPPKIVAGQLAAHYSMRNEPLPSLVVQALAAAMSLNRTVARQAWPDRAVAVEAASLVSADRPARRERAIVFDVVRWLSEHSEPLPREVFQAVVTALGLTEGGRLRQWVVEWVTPAPQPEMRLAEPRVGLRMPALLNAAIEYETQARLMWADDDGDDEADDCDDDECSQRGQRNQVTPPAALAEWLKEQLGIDVSKNTISAWVSTTQFQLAVYARAFWKSERSLQWRCRLPD